MTRRRVFNFVSVVSLLLCVGIVTLWARSYWRGYLVRLETESSNRYSVSVFQGHVELIGEWLLPQLRKPDNARREFQVRGFYPDPEDQPPPDARGDWSGFSYSRVDNPSGVDHSSEEIHVPLWFVALLSAVAPLIWFARRHRRMRRLATGRCGACGYSLACNTSGVCPECGTAIARKPEPVP